MSNIPEIHTVLKKGESLEKYDPKEIVLAKFASNIGIPLCEYEKLVPEIDLSVKFLDMSAFECSFEKPEVFKMLYKRLDGITNEMLHRAAYECVGWNEPETLAFIKSVTDLNLDYKPYEDSCTIRERALCNKELLNTGMVILDNYKDILSILNL